MTHSAKHNRPFNSALECGLRALFVLQASGEDALDLQRIVAYDYLLVHSADVEEGPSSLHPAVPHRGTELLVKRSIIQAGLNQMLSKELVEVVFSEEGFLYKATELTSAFIRLLTSSYAQNLKARAAWVVKHFGHWTNEEFESYMTQNVGRWGAEFETLIAVNLVEL